jgi:hypothetical protein
MFNKKEIEWLKQEVYNFKTKTPQFVECDICGCLLDGRKAFKGNARLGKETRYYYWDEPPFFIDVIEYPYYCKIHVPKVKK